MYDVSLLTVSFEKDGYWRSPIDLTDCPGPDSVELFDQNGYDLSPLEIMYSHANHGWHSIHRNHAHIALKRPWFVQELRTSGAVLNHSLIFERKGYAGLALEQLEGWARKNPLLWKVARYRPKWGIDFSMDYAGADGEVFEILHYEYDGFDRKEVNEMKLSLERALISIDWNDAAASLLRRKDEWHGLGFFDQSDWKCQFFGIGPEKFKMVAWA
jgi:hypothetical protein